MDAAVVGLPVPSPQPTQLTFEDGLGERRYALGSLSEPLEVLKLSSVLSAVSSFDFALRERAARLTGFRHESYARVRSVELDRRASALVIISDYVSGVRLSTILKESQKRSIPIDANVARRLVRQLVVSAAALQEAAPDVANGAIAPERLVITPTGRLFIVEYVLGAALEQLGHSRARYWRELGVALPGSVGGPPFDARADVTQIGTVALSLIVGRPLTTDEYPERLQDLVQGATLRTVFGGTEPMPSALRDWLRRALQLDQWDSFASPAEARVSLEEAFGAENAVAEMAAVQVFLARFASSDLAPEADLAPRLEAMKAFLARYPSRRAGETAPSEPPQTAAPAAVPLAPIATPPAVAETSRVEPPRVVESPSVVEPPRVVEAPRAIELPRAVQSPRVEAARFESEQPFEPVQAPQHVSRIDHVEQREQAERAAMMSLEPEPELELPPEIPAPTFNYAEERRSATPVPAWPTRFRIAIIAGGAALVLALVIGALLYSRSGGGPGLGTLSVGTTPPGIAVFVDGTPHGVTPLGVELPPGEHVVELRTETERRRIPVTLTAGGQVSQFFEFARPAPASGELLVRTEPLGATVTVDGQYVGRSPVSVPELSAGTHTVVMQHETGSVTERVLIENGRTASLVVSMTGGAQKSAAAGWIRVDVPTTVQVFEGGRLVGGSDVDRIMLPVGRHELEFVNPGLEFWERRTVQVNAGQVTPVRLQWPQGSMALNAIPWAEVFIDGTRVGETPIGNITVPIGPHEVLFRHPDLGERRMTVTVTAGDPLKVGVDLRSK
jgi:hypothetical protein